MGNPGSFKKGSTPWNKGKILVSKEEQQKKKMNLHVKDMQKILKNIIKNPETRIGKIPRKKESE